MSRLAVAEIVIPIVVGLGLAVWIAMVAYADRHPRQGGGDAPDRDVLGDTFRRDAGQASPGRGAPHDEPEGARQASQSDLSPGPPGSAVADGVSASAASSVG
jgi:hypothetical protein